MTTTTYDPTPMAARGAALLDERKPDWFERDWRYLLMNSSVACVLGKTYGDFWDGLRFLFGALDYDQGAAYGFTVPSGLEPPEDDYTAYWRALEAAWLREIARRTTTPTGGTA